MKGNSVFTTAFDSVQADDVGRRYQSYRFAIGGFFKVLSLIMFMGGKILQAASSFSNIIWYASIVAAIGAFHNIDVHEFYL